MNKIHLPLSALTMLSAQGNNDVGCFGSKDIKTPNFDLMAKEAMIPTHACVGSPVCGPNRAY